MCHNIAMDRKSKVVETFAITTFGTIANSLLGTNTTDIECDDDTARRCIINEQITPTDRREILDLIRTLGFGPNIERLKCSDEDLNIGVEVVVIKAGTMPYGRCCNNVNGGNEVTLYLYPNGNWKGGEVLVEIGPYETIICDTTFLHNLAPGRRDA